MDPSVKQKHLVAGFTRAGGPTLGGGDGRKGICRKPPHAKIEFGLTPHMRWLARGNLYANWVRSVNYPSCSQFACAAFRKKPTTPKQKRPEGGFCK